MDEALYAALAFACASAAAYDVERRRGTRDLARLGQT
jgi:hypothetical protein